MLAMLIPILPLALFGFVASFFVKHRASAIVLRWTSGVVLAIFAALVLLFIYMWRFDPNF